MPSPDPHSLEKFLDAAGRDAQPTVRGWQTLPARLAQTPQLKPALHRWATLPLGVAAVASILLVVSFLFFHRQPILADQPIEIRRQSVDLTILSVATTDGQTLYMPITSTQGEGGRPRRQELTGQALVKDRRLVLNLKAGDNVVKFTDIAASIDPTSVRFESLTDSKGTTVVEQSFEYDLATADALLKRFIDREIVCVEKNGQEIKGVLASYDDGTIVLKLVAEDKELSTQNVSRSALQALRLGEMPADLIVKPTLVWKLRSKAAGKHETLLSYICGFMKWQADYVIEVTPGEKGEQDLLDVNGWVTLENTSGTTYPKAGLRLIAGDVRRVTDPWSMPIAFSPDGNRLAAANFPVSEFGVILYNADAVGKLEFQEKSFFEYHLYALNLPCTVRDHQIKQLNLLQKKGAKAKRRYLFDPVDGRRHLTIELVVKNEKENELGIPLPKGNVTLQQRGTDGELAVIGETAIDHTAVKEELTLRYGHAFDIIGEHRELSVEKLGNNRRVTYETRIRNHKSTPAAIKCYAVRLGKTGVLREASLPHRVEEVQTIYFEFILPANAEQVIRYTVVYRSEK